MMKNLRVTHAQRGFTLPVILLISVGLMIIGLSLLQSTSAVRNSLDDQYQQRITNEAAEAGTVYANYCLSVNNFSQTWGPSNSKPNLSQNTDCTGSPLSSAPNYLLQNGTRRTGFSVGDLAARSDGAIVFSSNGTYEQTRGNSTVLASSATTTRKQVVRWKVYVPSVSSSGWYRTCGIVTNELYCWGNNGFGQLGDGTNTNSTTPVKVVQDAGLLANKVVNDLFTAYYHNCALAAKKVYCWGRNDYGQLGNNSTTNSNKPVAVSLPGDAIAVGGSDNTSCAIVLVGGAGKIYCWGNNERGTAGVGALSTKVSVPTEVATTGFTNGANYNATDLSTSGTVSTNMCAIVDGAAYCWGNNDVGQIGDGTTTTRPAPTAVVQTAGGLLDKTIISISQDGFPCGDQANEGCPGASPFIAFAHVCVVAKPTTGNNVAYCWGENYHGQLGNGSSGMANRSSVPVAVRANSGDVLYGKNVQDIIVGVRHSCALANSEVYCWGYNNDGQLGIGTAGGIKSVPQAVIKATPGLAGQTITAIGGGANRGCAVAGYQSYCWGVNTSGQIGDGTTTNRSSPTESVFLRPKAPAYIF